MRHVYVAHPIGPNDDGRPARLRAALDAARQLIGAGLAPFVPGLWVTADSSEWAGYEEWMAFDMSWLSRCDALLRVPGVSRGADREVELARRLRIPVFVTVEQVVAWARASDRPMEGGDAVVAQLVADRSGRGAR